MSSINMLAATPSAKIVPTQISPAQTASTADGLPPLDKLTIAGPSAALKFFGTPELLEDALLRDSISPTQLLELRSTSRHLRAMIDDTPSLQRKVFMGHRAGSADYIPNTNFTITLNEIFVPTNLDLEPFPDFYARKIRFCTKTDSAHVYELHWATYEDSTKSITTVVLCIEIFHRATIRRRCIPDAFLKTYLSDGKTGITAILKSESDGEGARTKMWVPGHVTFGKALEAAASWADGGFVEDDGADSDGMFVREDMWAD